MSLPAVLCNSQQQVLQEDLSVEPQARTLPCPKGGQISTFLEHRAKSPLLCTPGGRRVPAPGQPPGITCFTHIIPVLTRSWRDTCDSHLMETKCQLKVSNGFAQVPTFALSTATCRLLANSLVLFNDVQSPLKESHKRPQVSGCFCPASAEMSHQADK